MWPPVIDFDACQYVIDVRTFVSLHGDAAVLLWPIDTITFLSGMTL